MKSVIFLFSLSCCLYLVNSGIINKCPNPSDVKANHANLGNIMVECQLSIVEAMDFYSLVTVGHTSKYFAALAWDVFRRKHSHKIFQIWGEFDRHSMIEDHNDIVVIKNFDFALSMIRDFGPLIRHLEFVHNFNLAREKTKVYQVLSEHCAHSLRSLLLSKCSDFELHKFPGPLYAVENVTLDGTVTSMDSRFKINNIFPGIRRLTLSFVSELESTWFDVAVPNLEEVNVYRPFARDMKDAMEFLFRHNPQIKKFSFTSYNSFHFLKIANEYLPDLEELHIDFGGQSGHYEMGEMPFKAVKKLTTIVSDPQLLGIVSFDQLEELDLTCQSDDCLTIVDINTQLKVLRLHLDTIDDYEFIHLGRQLTNLKDLYISNATSITPDTVMRFLSENEHINSLVLCNPNEFLMDVLSDKAKHWHVTKQQNDILIKQF